MKKNLAAFRYSDQKVVPLYASEVVRGSYSATDASADTHSAAMLCKRVIDVVFSLVVMVLGLPFYGLIAILIKLTSEGPILFVQDRVGVDGRPFKFYKFRTMLVDNSDADHRSFAADFIKGRLMQEGEGADKKVFKLQNDPRVTSIGRFLRKTSLDELPQFINVLRGDMTLVGPRPPLAYELAHYKEWHRGRLAVKPGLTGLWQVSGRSTVPFDEMVMLDLYYIENWSLALDLKIILRTVPVMLFGLGGY
ncbi:MAG TPA: sugar transferase [Candidatus Krumholzibacteria bacterium]|nr:sugar transferase [Candidatus Krumholzibacteria bacterium]